MLAGSTALSWRACSSLGCPSLVSCSQTWGSCGSAAGAAPVWTFLLLIHCSAMRCGSVRAHGVLLWWGDLLRAAVYGRWDAGCGVWCPGSSVAWGVSWTVLIPGHQQGGLGPLKLPDFFFFFLFKCFGKGKSNLPAFHGLCCSALPFPCTPLVRCTQLLHCSH